MKGWWVSLVLASFEILLGLGYRLGSSIYNQMFQLTLELPSEFD